MGDKVGPGFKEIKKETKEEVKKDIENFIGIPINDTRALIKAYNEIKQKRKDPAYDKTYKQVWNELLKNKAKINEFNTRWEIAEKNTGAGIAEKNTEAGIAEKNTEAGFLKKLSEGFHILPFLMSPTYEKYLKMKNDPSFIKMYGDWKKYVSKFKETDEERKKFEKFNGYWKAYEKIDKYMTEEIRKEMEIKSYIYLDENGKERKLEIDPKIIIDIIARIKNKDEENIVLSLYNPKYPNRVSNDVKEMINNILTKLNTGIVCQETNTYATTAESLTIRKYTMVINKIYSFIPMDYKNGTEAIDAFKKLGEQIKKNQNSNDFNKFLALYANINKLSENYKFTKENKEEIDNIYYETLATYNAKLLSLAYKQMIEDPYNIASQAEFLETYKRVTSGQYGPLGNPIYEKTLSEISIKETGMNYPQLKSQYDSLLTILSEIEKLINYARINPENGTKEYEEFKKTIDNLSQYDKKLITNLLQQKYGSDLIEEYKNILKDEGFRKWRNEYITEKGFPQELINLKLETQYLIYKKVVPELKNKGMYNEETLQKLVNALKSVDEYAHNEYLKYTFPILFERFPNDFDMITGLSRAYQESVKSVQFERKKYENVREFWTQAGDDIKRMLSQNILQLINEFKQLPEEEQLKIRSQLDLYMQAIRALPTIGLESVTIPYKYIDLFNITDFSTIERMLSTQEAVRRQYPPGVFMEAVSYFIVIDILGETARQVTRRTYSEKPKFTSYAGGLRAETGESTTTTFIGEARGPESVVQTGTTIQGEKVNAANLYIEGIRAPYIGDINTFKFDYRDEEAVNLYLNTSIPNKYNYVSVAFYNNSGTYDVKNYIRILENGKSRWINIFSTKLSKEETEKWYGRYYDGTTDIRGIEEGGKAVGYVAATQVTNSIAIANIHSYSSDALGIIYNKTKSDGGLIKQDTKIEAKILSTNIEIEEPKKVGEEEKKEKLGEIRAKEIAVKTIIGQKLEVSAARDLENRREAYYFKNFIHNKKYQEFGYYSSLTDYLKTKAGSAYIETPLGESLTAWTLAKAIDINGHSDVSAINSLEIEGIGEIQISGGYEGRNKVTTLKFMGNNIGIEAATKKEKDKVTSILNSEIGISRVNLGGMYAKEGKREEYGAGITFPLGRWLVTTRNALLDGYKWNANKVGWLIGGQLYPHGPLSVALVSSGEVYKDENLENSVKNLNFGVFVRNWPKGEFFLVVDDKYKNVIVTGGDEINKFGIKSGYTYYSVKPDRIDSITFSGKYENDIINKKNILSTDLNFKRTTENKIIGISGSVSYERENEEKAKGILNINFYYARRF
ncbi:MAG: hypothetical protein QXE90_04040 [Candidatus Micrarchaeia archaeon]